MEKLESMSEGHLPAFSFDKEDRLEFRDFCVAQERLRQNPGNTSVLGEHCAESDGTEFQKDDLLQIFSLLLIFILGIVVRVFLKRTKCTVPYTVVLMVVGLFLGQLARTICPHLRSYTAIARTKPEIILMTFLPILIFESAFSLSVHTFMKSAVQILIVALPGMLISTFLTALASMFLLRDYRWNFVDASLFGSIVSATDPVAVVAILRELGASETLSVLIEGESLLNDGVAILLFEIFKEIMELPAEEALGLGPMALNVSLKFIQIAIGGPIFGYLMAKIAVISLSKVYNDPTVEISITLCAAYLTYFIGEEIFGVSGIMAVVALGIKLSSERTCISPESQKAVHHFWEMLGYLANTVLFVLIGVIIGERALIDVEWTDGLYLLILYASLLFIRLFMLTLLSPLLSRIGYGLEWKDVLIMSWGGLRGAVGLCLALEVYENPHLCDRKELGPKVLFQTAGIVFLTLVVNATTTKKLMEFLNVTKVSEGRRAGMENAMKILLSTRERALAALKNDRFVADSDWNIVSDLTLVSNPYDKNVEIPKKSLPPHVRRIMLAQLIAGVPLIKKKCPKCESARKAAMTLMEYQELAEEARIRILKALKMSFWRQYQQGVIKGLAVQILIGICDRAEDFQFKMIGSRDISKYWAPNSCFSSQRDTTSMNSMSDLHLHRPEKFPHELLPPISSTNVEQKNWRFYIHLLVSQTWFNYFVDFALILSLVSTIVEMILSIKLVDECSSVKPLFIALNILVALVFLADVVAKLIVYQLEEYLHCRWHYVDLFVLVLSIGDVILSSFPCDSGHAVFKSIGLLKVIRLFQYLEALGSPCNYYCFGLGPKISQLVRERNIERIYLGYEIGKGFVTGCEQVFKLIPLMPDESRSLQRLKGAMEREKMEVVRELGKLQRTYPEVAIGAKTRHACRAVLNQMRHTLIELTADGLVDEAEDAVLIRVLEKKMKRLSQSPASIPPASPETTLRNLIWFKNNEKLLEFMLEKAILMTLVPGDEIYSVGDPPKGIFLIVTGLVKVQFNPTDKVLTERKRFGVIPNCELLTDLKFMDKSCDMLSSGSLIGEVGFLKHQERAASAICETFVTAYHFPNALLDEASFFKDSTSPSMDLESFECRVWRSWGLKVATALFQRHPEYDNWSFERIQGHLERSIVPIINSASMFRIPDFVSDVIVVEGYFQNYESQEIYVAPCLVPHSCSWLFSKRNPMTINRILMISHEDIDMDSLKFTNGQSASGGTSKLVDLLGKVDDEISRALSYPMKMGGDQRLDVRQRRMSIAISNARRSLDSSDRKLSLEDIEKGVKGQTSSMQNKRRRSLLPFGINRVNSLSP